MDRPPPLLFNSQFYERALILRAQDSADIGRLGDRGLALLEEQSVQDDLTFVLGHIVTGAELRFVYPDGRVVKQPYNVYELAAKQDELVGIDQDIQEYQLGTGLVLEGKQERAFDSCIEFCGCCLNELWVQEEDPEYLDRLYPPDHSGKVEDIRQEILQGYLAHRLMYADLRGMHALSLAICSAACGVLKDNPAAQAALNRIQSAGYLLSEDMEVFRQAINFVRQLGSSYDMSSAARTSMDMVEVTPNTPSASNLRLALAGFAAGTLIRNDPEDSVRFSGINAKLRGGTTASLTLQDLLANAGSQLVDINRRRAISQGSSSV